jgi:S1-C subfamily serine protease
MSSQFQRLPAATVQIRCEDSWSPSTGSGFHLHSEEYVVTNAHVVEPALTGTTPVIVRTETGDEAEATVRTHSPPSRAGGHDYAILEVQGELGDDRIALQPRTADVERGDEVLFAGYPHGIGDLLVHHAHVSGRGQIGFYIDGAVNGGNSGGPIVDTDTGDAVGLVTYKRYVEPDEFQRVIQELQDVREASEERTGFLHDRGVDMQKQARVLAEAGELLEQALKLNANTGIGIGQPIHHAAQAIDELTRDCVD